MTLARVAEFRRATGSYLSTPAVAALQAAAAFTVEFWKNSVTVGPDRAYAGHGAYNTAGGGGWRIASGDGVNGGNSLRVLLATNSNGSAYAAGTTPQATLAADWSQAVVVFNGAGSGNTGRLQVYLDGVAQTLTFTGTIPATLPLPTLPFELGRFNGLSGWELDAGMNRLRFWTSALNSTEVTALYHNGAGYDYATAPWGTIAPTPTASWELNETGGSRADSGPNGLTLTQQNGTVAGGQLATRVRDRSGAALDFTAAFCAAPRWLPTGLNNMPCWQTDGRQSLTATAADWSTTAGGDWLQVVALDALFAAGGGVFDHGLLGSGDLDTATRYAFSMIYEDASDLLSPRFRLRQDAVPNGMAIGQTTLSVGTPYLLHWRGGTAEASGGYALRVNRADIAVTLQTGMDNVWLANVTGRETQTPGSFATAGATQGQSRARFGTQLAFGPMLTRGTARLLERWLAGRSGVGI